MHMKHWGLSNSPFGAVDLSFFHESPTHQEALARLHYLVENGRRLGLLLGEPGSGKSLLLREFARQLGQRTHKAVYLSLLGIDDNEFLGVVAERLGARVHASDPRFALWRKITDRLTENRYQQLPTTLLLDDAHEALPAVLQQVLRLLQSAATNDCPLSIVIASAPKNVGRLGPRLLDLAELRIDVGSWSVDETANYLHDSIARAGGQKPVFDPAATSRLYQLTQGVPRRVSQLAELSLLAGAGEELPQVDDQTVDSVYRELSVTSSER